MYAYAVAMFLIEYVVVIDVHATNTRFQLATQKEKKKCQTFIMKANKEKNDKDNSINASV